MTFIGFENNRARDNDAGISETAFDRYEENSISDNDDGEHGCSTVGESKKIK